MKPNLRLLRDTIHNASSVVVGSDNPVCSYNGKVAAYGKGVLVGLVAGMMSMGMAFDDAWKLLLEQGVASSHCKIDSVCVPDGWPSLTDYARVT